MTQYSADGAELFHLRDGLGSLSALANQSADTIEPIQYQAYGSLIRAGPMAQMRYALGIDAFTGREYDFETGLYFYRSRYYDSQMGIFTSADPAGPLVDINSYRYTYNRPTNLTDPSGAIVPVVAPILIGAAAGAAMGAAGTAAIQYAMYGCYDSNSVGAAGAAGAVGGALAPFLGTTAIGGAALGSVTAAGQYYLTTNKFSSKEFAFAVGTGGAVGALSPFVVPVRIFAPATPVVVAMNNITTKGLTIGSVGAALGAIVPAPACACKQKR